MPALYAACLIKHAWKELTKVQYLHSPLYLKYIWCQEMACCKIDPGNLGKGDKSHNPKGNLWWLDYFYLITEVEQNVEKNMKNIKPYAIKKL